MNSNQKTARIAGLWYLAIAVFYSFSMIYVDSVFFVSGNVDATVKNIQASGLMFRLGFVSCLIGHVCFLFLVNTLYKLFSGVSRELARLMVIIVIAGVSAAFINRLNQVAAIILLDSNYLIAFSTVQINTLATFFLDLHQHGEMMIAIIWGLWLLPLGLLIIKSGFIPKVLGILLIVACVCYITDFIIYYFNRPLMAVIHSPLSIVETVAEVSFILWLLIKGVKKQGSPIEAPTVVI